MCKKVFPYSRVINTQNRFFARLRVSSNSSRASAKRVGQRERKGDSPQKKSEVRRGNRRETFNGQVVILVKKGAVA